MSVAKIIEITAESKKSFKDAVEIGVERASSSVKNVISAWVKDQEVVVKKGKVVAWRVSLKVTFLLKK